MAKFFQIVLVVGLIAVAVSEPPRRFNHQRFQNRNRFFARQEIAPNAAPAPSATPYPPAGEKPDIPFDLPNQEAGQFPDPTYGPPDQTYGPPDQTYGPPQPEDALPAEPDNYDDQEIIEPEAERLVFGQRNLFGKSSRLVLQKGQRTRTQAAAQLRRPAATAQFEKSAKLRQPVAARLQKQNFVAQPILLQDGTLVYSILS